MKTLLHALKTLAAVAIVSLSLQSCTKGTDPQTPAPLQLQVLTSSANGFSINATLITGNKDAILIDAQFTLSDAANLVRTIQATGKNLTTIYITHSHPDHYFGLVPLKQAFPNARIVALPAVVADIQRTWQAKVAQWKPSYGDDITSNPIIPDVLDGTTLNIEGNELKIFGNVQGDEANNSYVWVPSLKAVVCGDIDYNGVFPWTLETNAAQRVQWINTLNNIAALNPSIVVPGHQNPTLRNDASSLDFTRTYLAYYDSVLPTATSSADFQNKIKTRFPGLQLDVILQIAADAAFAQ